jgi:hypothetical protein
VVVVDESAIVVVVDAWTVVVDDGSTVVVVDESTVVVVVVSFTATAIPGAVSSRKRSPAASQPPRPGPFEGLESLGPKASKKKSSLRGKLRTCLPRATRIPGRLAIGERHYPEIPKPQSGRASRPGAVED